MGRIEMTWGFDIHKEGSDGRLKWSRESDTNGRENEGFVNFRIQSNLLCGKVEISETEVPKTFL